MTLCAYCRVKPAVHRDHLITKSQGRRRAAADAARHLSMFIVKSCPDCNWAKGTRLLVPASHEHLIAELERLTMGRYRVWRGDAAESLREVYR